MVKMDEGHNGNEPGNMSTEPQSSSFLTEVIKIIITEN